MDAVQTENTKRIAKNTLMLYVRMLFSMVVSLYTSRVILNTLGVEDFGIQNVVGGFVGMFSLISGSLSAAISRFLTFELGAGNRQRLKQVFSTSLVVQVLLAVFIVLLLETVGLWFLNHKMVIPPERMFAANCLLQFSILSFAVGLISLPYNASIVSHEHLTVFAYIGICEVMLKLMVVLSLKVIPDSLDKLIYFSLVMLGVSLALQFFYWVYCTRHFEECRFRLRLERPLLKEMLGFAGWNFIGASSAVLRDQGGNVVLNLFWGPTLNAARGIAQQVNNAISGFVGNFMVALNPQITKSYAAGDRDYTMSLVHRAARFSFYVMFIISLPILFNTSFLIALWLGQVPAHVVLFVRLVIVFSLCETLSNPLVTVMLATGKIRNYQIVVGGLQLLNLPIAYLLLRWGLFPEVIMVVAISLSLVCLVARLLMLRTMIGLSIRRYLREVVLNILFVVAIAVVLPLVMGGVAASSWLRFLLSCATCMACAMTSVYFLGCNRQERQFVSEKSRQFVKRFVS